jgi:hypothetical protein
VATKTNIAIATALLTQSKHEPEQGSEDCLDHFLAGRSEFPETEGVSRHGFWNDLQSAEDNLDPTHANDNLFGGLSSMRDANARYGVAA